MSNSLRNMVYCVMILVYDVHTSYITTALKTLYSTCFVMRAVLESLSFMGVKLTSMKSFNFSGFPLMGHRTFSSCKEERYMVTTASEQGLTHKL